MVITILLSSLALSIAAAELHGALPRVALWLIKRAERSLDPASREFYGWRAEAEAQRECVRRGDLSPSFFLLNALWTFFVARVRVPTSDRRRRAFSIEAIRATYATLHPTEQQIVRHGTVAILGFVTFGFGTVLAAALHAPRGAIQVFAFVTIVCAGSCWPLNKKIDRYEAEHPKSERR